MKPLTVSENTKLTLGVVTLILGAVSFVTRIYFLADSNAASITDLQKNQEAFSRDIAEISADTRFMKQLMMEDREKRNGHRRNY